MTSKAVSYHKADLIHQCVRSGAQGNVPAAHRKYFNPFDV